MPAINYIGYTAAGDLVARSSTRADYTHASVETQSVAYVRTEGRDKWGRVKHRYAPSVMRDFQGLVPLSDCHFSTSYEGAAKLCPAQREAGAAYEVVEVTQVDTATYNKARKAAKAGRAA